MGWIIAGAVLIVILLLLLCTVTVVFDYRESVFLRISYLCFTVFKLPAKKEKTVKKDKKAKKDAKKVAKKASKKAEKDAEKADDPEEKKKPTLTDILELVKLALDSLGKPLKKLLKRTEFSHLSLDIVCGGDDAAKAAINYGTTNIAVGTGLTLIDSFFTLKTPDDIHVDVDFYLEKTRVECYCEVRLTLCAALAFVFTLLGRALKYYLTHPDAKSAVKKFVK